MDREKENKYLHLPQETIEEILSRLPVKSLLRFKCVSKSWRSLFGSKRFIQTHLQNSTRNPSLARQRVILYSHVCAMKQCSLHSLLNEPSIDPSSPIDTPIDNHKYFRIVGCCNGLVCFLNSMEGGRVLLWNPVTRIFLDLPKTKLGSVSKYGFGWDEKTGAYKVFAGGKVYSTKTNSWEEAEGGSLPWHGETGKLVSGKLHWLVGSGKYIESFDLEGEAFGRIELPFDEESWLLGEIGGCLRAMYDYRDPELLGSVVEIWVMKEYGVKESWMKLVKFPLVFRERFMPVAPLLGNGPNGEVFLIYRNNFAVYNARDGEIATYKNVIDFDEGHVYVESLVSRVGMVEQCVEALGRLSFD